MAGADGSFKEVQYGSYPTTNSRPSEAATNARGVSINSPIQEPDENDGVEANLIMAASIEASE